MPDPLGLSPETQDQTQAQSSKPQDPLGLSPVEMDAGEYAQRAQQAGINVGRSAEEHQQALQGSGQFSSQGVQALMGGYKQAQAKQEFKDYSGTTLEHFKRNYMPFLGDIFDTKGHKDYFAAKQRADAGQAQPEDYTRIAKYERLRDIDTEMGKSFLGGTVQTVGSLSKLFVEGMVGGAALSGAGKAVGGGVGRFLGGTAGAERAIATEFGPELIKRNLLKQIGTHAGRAAILTAAAPAFYVDEARTRNIEAGRAPDDIRGYPGAFLHGYSNMLVLGSVAKLMGGEAGTAAGRIAKGIGVGVGEQQIADVAGGAWDQLVGDTWKTQTKFGALGDFIRGDFGEAAHKLAMQAVTFGAFGGLHELGYKLDTRAAKQVAEKKMDEAVESHFGKDFADEVAAEMKNGIKRDEAIRRVAERRLPQAETETKQAIYDADQESIDRAENEGMPPVPDRAQGPESIVPDKQVRNRQQIEDDIAGAQRTIQEYEKAARTLKDEAGNDLPYDRVKDMASQIGPWKAKLAELQNELAGTQAPDAQTNVQATTIAQAEPKAGVGDPSSPTEIVPPANANEAAGTPEAPNPAHQAPEGVQAQPQTPVAQTAAPVAARPIEGGSGQFHVVGDMVVPDRSAKHPAGHIPGEYRAFVTNWLMDSVVEARGRMTPEQHVEYLETIDKWVKSATDHMVHDVYRNLQGVKVYGDPLTLAREAIAHDLSDPRVSAEWKLRLGDELKKGTVFGGAVKPMPGDRVVLRIDGGIKDAAFGRYGTPDASLTTHGVWAHEMGHVIDNGRVYSNGSRWTEIHGEEMTAKEGDPPLTLYAETEGPHESFAEFFRILHGSDRSLAEIERDFPEASKFFKEKGWWPPERTTESTGPLGNLFESKVELPDGGHGDVLAKPKLGPPKPPPPNKAAIEAKKKGLAPKGETPAPEPVETTAPEVPVLEPAPKGSWEEEAKAAGFTEPEIAILNLRARKTPIGDIAQKMGLTVGQVVTMLKRAQNKLGSTSKARKADESGLPTGVDEALKGLFSDPRDYKIMRLRLAGGSMDDVANKTGLSKSTIKKAQDKALQELGLPEGEEGLKALQEKIDADLAKRYEGEKYMLERRLQEENDLGIFGDSQLMRAGEKKELPNGDTETRKTVDDNEKIENLGVFVSVYGDSDPQFRGGVRTVGEAKKLIARESAGTPLGKWVVKSSKGRQSEDGWPIDGQDWTVYHEISAADAYFADEVAKGRNPKDVDEELKSVGAKRSNANSQLMRRQDEPMSEKEREMLRAVQENPQDQTLRLILADAIEEGETAMAGARARDIRRDVENPPSDKGVSHFEQLHEDQQIDAGDDPRFKEILSELTDNFMKERSYQKGDRIPDRIHDKLATEAYERYYAEKEGTGDRLELKLPPELEDFYRDGLLVFTTRTFGPRFYGRATPGELHEFFGETGIPVAEEDQVHFRIPFDSAMTTDPSGQPLGRLSGSIKIEYKSSEHGDFGPHAEIISNEETQRKYREKKTVDFHISEVDGGQDIANMRKMVLSVTIPKKMAGIYVKEMDRRRGRDYPISQISEVMDRMGAMGYKRVVLENGDLRYDSPLRQQLRAEQARGLRTGESQFIMGSLKSLKDTLTGARSSTAKDKAKEWWEKLLTGSGGQPHSLYEQKIERDNRIRVEAQQVTDAYDDLTKAVGGDWRTVSAETKEMMYRSRFVDAFLGSFKPEIAKALKTMWRHIDVLEQRLFQEGVLDNKLDVKFAAYGPYLTKQHMAFIDPNWAKNVDPEVVNRFRVWYINEMRRGVAAGTMKEKFPDEIEGMIKEMLSGKVGQEWIDALKGRKDLPVPVRELLGEVRDPVGAYAYSIGNQARLLHNAIFLRKITELGEKEGWMSKTQGSEGWKRVAEDDATGPLKHLKDYYAAPEVVKAIREAFGPRPEGSAMMKAYMKALGVFKYGKTVVSLTSHVRQSLGNTMFILRNGYSRADLKAAHARIKEMYGDTEKGRAYFRDLILRNIADSGVHLSEFRETGHDALGVDDPFDISTKVVEGGLARWIKKGLDPFQKLYRWEDLVPKIVGYEGEQARIKRSHPEWSGEQVKSEAAKRVNELFPTFNRVSPTIQALRKFPLVGPFVSFSSEVVRTTYHTARRAWAELHATKTTTETTVDAKGNRTTMSRTVPDAETRATGVRRMTGLVGSLSAFAALGALTRWMAGMTLEEEDAIRQFLPEWSKDSQLLHLGKDEKGKPMVIDLGRTDPHSMLWEPFQAAITSARTGTGGPFDVLEAAVKPYIQEELGTRTLLDIARNKMEKGGGQGQGMVYNPESSLAAKGGQIGGHILKGLEPGVVDQLLRTTGAIAGLPPNPGGKPRNAGEELLADFTGQRMMTVDANENLKFAAKTFLERRKNAEHEVNQLVARNRQQGVRLKPEDVQAEFARGEEMRRNVFDDFVSQVQAARLLGMTPGEVAKELKAAGVSQEAIAAVLGGKYRPRNQAEVLQRR